MNLDKIAFVLENCDVIEVPGKYVGECWAEITKTRIGRIASNAYGEEQICESFVLELYRGAERVRHPFDDPSILKTHTVFERLSFGDITSICMTVDGVEKRFTVPWRSDDGVENRYQISKVGKSGHLYITISEKSIFDEVFPADIIDDLAANDLLMRLYGRGKAFQEE